MSTGFSFGAALPCVPCKNSFMCVSADMKDKLHPPATLLNLGHTAVIEAGPGRYKLELNKLNSDQLCVNFFCLKQAVLAPPPLHQTLL